MWGKRFAAVIMAGLCCFLYLVISGKGSGDGIKEVSEYTDMNEGKKYYEKTVAVTFDDGPDRITTMKLLDGLKQRGIRASFFVIGENIEGNEDIIERMHNEGHIIGNHTYSHVELSKLSEGAAINEVQKTNDIIEDITGEPVKYIRPPCGSWDDRMLYDIDLTPVFWSVDPMDWCTGSSSLVVSRVMSSVSDGDIILFHDIYDSSVTAALEVIDRLSAQGYRFVTIDDILIE